MLKGIGLLILWFIVFLIVSSLVAPTLSRTPYPQPLDIAVLACAPLGAYHAARYRMPELLFLLYGMTCSSFFALNVFIGWAGPYHRGAWNTTKADDWSWTVTACLVTVGLGLACRFVAQWRWDRTNRSML